MVNPEMSREGEEKSRIDCDRYIPFLRAVKECMERASSSDADSKEQLRSDLPTAREGGEIAAAHSRI